MFVINRTETVIGRVCWIVLWRLYGFICYVVCFVSCRAFFAVNFRIDYVNADGNISNYYPDFIVKVSEKEIYIVETKGLEVLDVPLKMERLKQWSGDINNAQANVRYNFVYVDEESFKKYNPKTFKSLVDSFREYKE